jgi:hypothetical protein
LNDAESFPFAKLRVRLTAGTAAVSEFRMTARAKTTAVSLRSIPPPCGDKVAARMGYPRVGGMG